MTDDESPFRDRPGLPAAVIASAAGVFCTGDEQLRLTVFNAASGVTLAIRGRFLDIDGHVQVLEDVLTPTTARAASTKTLRLGCGWLLGVQVLASAGTPITGQCFAMLSLVRGDGTAGIDQQTLAAGYVTAVQRLAFPGSPVQGSLDGGGAIRAIAGTTPAAGAEISEAVPTGARWELLSFAFTLTTSAGVANRAIVLTLDDGTTVYSRSTSNVNQTASVGWNYQFMQGYGNPAISLVTALQAPIPSNIRLGAGHRIRTVTGAIQVADQFSAIQYLVREWIEGA